MVEPGRAGRLNLSDKVEVRPRGKHQCRLRLAEPADTAQLNDAAKFGAKLQCFDAGQPDMVGAAVGAVDHGIGRAGQLVVQSLVDQLAGDRPLRRTAQDGVAVQRPFVSTLPQRLADGADDIAARAQLTQFARRTLRHRPLARIAFGREAHRFQMLQAPDHQAAEARIVRAGPLRAQVDDP